MGQVTIYLDDEIEAKMRSAAKNVHLSQSKWISNLIKEKVIDEWPDSVRELSGAWKDLPTLNEIRNIQNTDLKREDL